MDSSSLGARRRLGYDATIITTQQRPAVSTCRHSATAGKRKLLNTRRPTAMRLFTVEFKQEFSSV